MTNPAMAVPPSDREGGTAPRSGPGAATTGSGSPSRHPRLIGELIFVALILALGVFTLTGVFTIRVPVGNRVGPTAFPVIVAALLLLTGLAVLIGVLRGKFGAADESEDTDPHANTDWLTILKLVALVVAQLLLIEVIGWTLSATLLFGGTAWVLGAKKWWLSALIGFVLSFAVQIVFGELLGLSLPLGPLFAWLAPLI